LPFCGVWSKLSGHSTMVVAHVGETPTEGVLHLYLIYAEECNATSRLNRSVREGSGKCSIMQTIRVLVCPAEDQFYEVHPNVDNLF
jgi:hypothetical protein